MPNDTDTTHKFAIRMTEHATFTGWARAVSPDDAKSVVLDTRARGDQANSDVTLTLMAAPTRTIEVTEYRGGAPTGDDVRAELLTVSWNKNTRWWTVAARASADNEWTSWDGPEAELGNLLSLGHDVVTGG